MRSHCSSIRYATDRGQHHGSTPDLLGLSTIQRPILVTATCYEYDCLCLKRQSPADQIERVTAIGLEFVFGHRHNTTQHNTTQHNKSSHRPPSAQAERVPTTGPVWTKQVDFQQCSVSLSKKFLVTHHMHNAHSDLPLGCSKVTEIQPRFELKLIKAVSRF